MFHEFFPITFSSAGYNFRLLGSVSAGFPSAAEEELQDTVTLDEYLISNREASCFLKMPDEAMTPAGIMQDDLVIVQRGKVPVSGDIVVAQVETEWVIRRLEKSGFKSILQPDNPQYRPVYPGDEVRVDGVVTGVVRKYY